MAPKTIGAVDAKAHFSRLLARVARGESITITRYGAPVARLVPVAPAPHPGNKDEIVARFRSFARRHRMSEAMLKSMREEGRR